MVGSSAMVGWFNKEGHAKIKQYYLQGTKTTQVIPNKGELPLTNIPSAVALHGATMYMAFQIKPETPLTHQPILLAFGSAYPVHNHLSHHDDKTTILFDFSAGLFVSYFQLQSKLYLRLSWMKAEATAYTDQVQKVQLT